MALLTSAAFVVPLGYVGYKVWEEEPVGKWWGAWLIVLFLWMTFAVVMLVLEGPPKTPVSNFQATGGRPLE